MVNLAKIRKKAKSGGPRSSAAPAAGDGGPPQKTEAPAAAPPPAPTPVTPQAKLEKFIASAGAQRFVRQAAPAAAPDEVELLTFQLGGERYAIDIDRIAQVIDSRPVTPIPNAPPAIKGILSLRGSMVTLIDIRSRLRQRPRGSNADPRIVVIRDPGGLIGFEVDRVLRPAKVERSSIEPQPVVDPGEESEAIRGVIRSENSLTIVLDLVKLLQ